MSQSIWSRSMCLTPGCGFIPILAHLCKDVGVLFGFKVRNTAMNPPVSTLESNFMKGHNCMEVAVEFRLKENYVKVT